MNAKVVGQLGLILQLSGIAVLLLSIYLSAQGGRSMGLSSLGTVMLVLGIAIKFRARRA